MPQYTAASLVLENRALAGPDSLYSLPTSASQEDHNANAMTAARHAYEIVTNTRQVLAIELYTAARAIDLRLREHPDLQPGKGTQAAQHIIRQHVPYHRHGQRTARGRPIPGRIQSQLQVADEPVSSTAAS